MPSVLWTLERAREAVDRAFATARQVNRVGAALAGALVLAGCGEEDDGVTYANDVRSIFNLRCTTCHRPGSPILVDIQNPYADVECVTEDGEEVCNGGLVNMNNTWAQLYPGETPARNVVPGDPENSFLMYKLSGDVPANGHGGAPMPLQVEWETKATDVRLLEDWIRAGAPRGAFMAGTPPEQRNFVPDIQNIFGTQEGRGYTGGKCLFCHYEGTPNPPNLNDPFGPDGLINVTARYRADRVRVIPGNPDDSFLMAKVAATRPEGDIGAQMPYSYQPLRAAQLEVVRQWIEQGARP